MPCRLMTGQDSALKGRANHAQAGALPRVVCGQRGTLSGILADSSARALLADLGRATILHGS